MKVSISLIQDEVTCAISVRFTLFDPNSDSRLNAQAFGDWLRKRFERTSRFFDKYKIYGRGCLCEISLDVFPIGAKQIENLLNEYKPKDDVEGITAIEYIMQPPANREAAEKYAILNDQLIELLNALRERMPAKSADELKSQVEQLDQKMEKLRVSSKILIDELANETRVRSLTTTVDELTGDVRRRLSKAMAKESDSIKRVISEDNIAYLQNVYH